METFVDIFLHVDGEKASVIDAKLLTLGLKHSLGTHDYLYDWKGIIDNTEILQFAEKIQTALKDTGIYFKLTTMR